MRKFKLAFDIIIAIGIIAIFAASGFDIITLMKDSKAEHSARYCARVCENEFDARLINVGLDGHKVTCNCEEKK